MCVCSCVCLIDPLPPPFNRAEAAMIDAPFDSQSDSFYFVGDELIMHNKAMYAYVDYPVE